MRWCFFPRAATRSKRRLANINPLFRKHRRLGVVYIGVCSNDVESADELGNSPASRGMIFTIYRDPQGPIARQARNLHRPVGRAVDTAGKLVHRGGLETVGGRLAFDAAVVGKTTPRRERASAFSRLPSIGPGQETGRNDPVRLAVVPSELVFERIPDAVALSLLDDHRRRPTAICCACGTAAATNRPTIRRCSCRGASRANVAWSEPQVLIAGPKPLPGNGVIFVDGHKRVWIVWCRMESARPIGRGQGWDNCRLMFRTSADNGVDVDGRRRVSRRRVAGRAAQSRQCGRSDGSSRPAGRSDCCAAEGSVFLIGDDGGTNGGREASLRAEASRP